MSVFVFPAFQINIVTLYLVSPLQGKKRKICPILHAYDFRT
jgi:hypothetical protein